LSGLNMSDAVPMSQSGLTGFQLAQQQTPTEVILTRTPAGTGTQTNVFEFEKLTTGPTAAANFTLRLTTYANRGASGAPMHDFNVSAVRNVTNYEVNFAFPGTASVGAIRMEFCDDPVPDLECTLIPGLNVADAV